MSLLRKCNNVMSCVNHYDEGHSAGLARPSEVTEISSGPKLSCSA